MSEDKQQRESMAAWPLLKVVSDGMKPEGKYTIKTLSSYRRACRLYERFRGGTQLACEVTLPLLEMFQAWQYEQGYTGGSVLSVCQWLATIVRYADEEILPRHTRRATFFDGDTAGTLEEFMLREYFPANTRIASRDTERLYGMAVARLSKFLERPATLADLNDRTIGLWLRSMRDEGLSAHTVNGNLCKIRALWSWCAKRRIIDKFPTLADVPAPRRIPTCWTKEQMQALIDGCAPLEEHIAGVPITKWFKAFILVAFDTGERSGALMRLRWEHYNAETRELEAPAEIRKGRKKPMLYKIKPATAAILEEIRQPKRQVIFEWRANMATFHNHYKRLLKKAGLPYERRKSGPQKIRRTFASYIELNGGNATAALDHTSRKTTVESYLDPRIIQAPPANLLLPDLTVTA